MNLLKFFKIKKTDQDLNKNDIRIYNQYIKENNLSDYFNIKVIDKVKYVQRKYCLLGNENNPNFNNECLKQFANEFPGLSLEHLSVKKESDTLLNIFYLKIKCEFKDIINVIKERKNQEQQENTSPFTSSTNQ